jgi:hypothetical protein
MTKKKTTKTVQPSEVLNGLTDNSQSEKGMIPTPPPDSKAAAEHSKSQVDQEKEIATWKKQLEELQSKCPVFYEKNKEDGKVTVSMRGNCNDESKRGTWEEVYHFLCDLTGTKDKELAWNIIKSGEINIARQSDDAAQRNVILQSLFNQKPKDAHEARLICQAAALYSQGMNYLNRAGDVLSPDDGTFAKDHWTQIFMNHAMKILDLHNKTLEALSRYRQRGEQKIVVQYVNVSDGGQAVVGQMVANGGGSINKNHGIPHGNS